MIFEKCTKIEKGEFFQQMILRKLYRVIINLKKKEFELLTLHHTQNLTQNKDL